MPSTHQDKCEPPPALRTPRKATPPRFPATREAHAGRAKRLDLELSSHLKASESKIQSLVEREELAAQRERALADTIERLVGMERGVADRDKKLAKREEELIKLQNERLHALEGREREMQLDQLLFEIGRAHV